MFLIALLEIGERLAEGDGDARELRRGGRHADQAGALCATPSPASVRSRAAQPAEQHAATGDLTGLRVLIAEDNPVNQEVLLRQVGRLGLAADAVANGQEVLDALRERSYDAVLMDCQMPVMDGYTATREIRVLEQDGRARTPIVAVTANAMRDDLDRCRDAGMDEFVAKPVTLAALAGAIEHSIETSRAARGHASAERVGAAGPVEVAAGAQTEPAAAGSAARRREPSIAQRSIRCARTSVAPTRCCGSCGCSSSSSTPQAEQIDREARGGELETLARNAHRMKSSAATLGASELAELLAQLEATAGAGDAPAAEQLAATFAAAVTSAREAFEALLEELDVEVSAGG